MKFNQNKEDGSCDLEFNEEEIKIISNKKNELLRILPKCYENIFRLLSTEAGALLY